MFVPVAFVNRPALQIIQRPGLLSSLFGPC
jgi:hypothetical protein